MSIFKTNTLEDLTDFATRTDQLAIVERSTPTSAASFFPKLLTAPFEAIGKVHKKSALIDIKTILDEKVSKEIQSDPFYHHWTSDMAEVCKKFCDIENSNAISFWLGTQRGCRRYHIDNVPQRMLVTYSGKGTEWVPDEAVSREAFANGEPNERIVKDPSALQFINQWDVAVFRGGPKGLLHRTPDAALKHLSILMRLDQLSFWENVLKYQKQIDSIPA